MNHDTIAKGADCSSGMSLQSWLYVTLGPDLGELAMGILFVAAVAAIVGLIFLIMKMYQAV